MSLSDNPVSRKRSPPRRAIDAQTNKSWSDKQKLEAVQSYLLLGNLALTSRVLAIPEITLRVWKRSDWWNTAIAEFKAQEKIEMSARLKKIVGASLAAVEDRLQNGDVIYDQKTGEMTRKPVNMKDAHKVAVDLLKQQDVLEKAVNDQPTEQKDDDRLLKLAEKFATFVTDKLDKKEVLDVVEDVTDVEIKESPDAIHEERST